MVIIMSEWIDPSDIDELDERLEEAGVRDEVCMLAEAIYEEVRFLWQEIGQKIGMAAGMLKQIRDDAELWDNLPEPVSNFLNRIITDDIRQEFFTTKLKRFMEVVYDGGNNSLGGLNFLSDLCRFRIETGLWYRKRNEATFYRAIALLYDAIYVAGKEAPNAIEGIMALVEDLNNIIYKFSRDIFGNKRVFNVSEIRQLGNSAIKSVLNYVEEAETLRYLLRR